MQLLKTIVTAAIWALFSMVASANAVFKWEFSTFTSSDFGNGVLGQSNFLTNPAAQLRFLTSFAISEAAFTTGLAFRYLQPNALDGFDAVNNGLVDITAGNPRNFLDSSCPDPATSQFPCGTLPRFALFGGVVQSGNQTLFGGAVSLPSPIIDDELLCVSRASPILGEYCARSGPGLGPDMTINMTSDTNGLWTGSFGVNVTSATFTGRYVLDSGSRIPEPTTLLSILIGLPMLGFLNRRRKQPTKRVLEYALHSLRYFNRTSSTTRS
jgi:hypothetical protein